MVKLPTETKSHSSADFNQIAEQLQFFVHRYRDLAKRLEDNKISTVEVPAVKSRNTAIRFLQGGIKLATAAVDSAIIHKSAPQLKTPIPRSTESIVEEIEEIEGSERSRKKNLKKKAKP